MTRKPTPKGTNMMPMRKNAGSTVPAVNMGCHAGSLCCLNLVSVKWQNRYSYSILLYLHILVLFLFHLLSYTVHWYILKNKKTYCCSAQLENQHTSHANPLRSAS